LSRHDLARIVGKPHGGGEANGKIRSPIFLCSLPKHVTSALIIETSRSGSGPSQGVVCVVRRNPCSFHVVRLRSFMKAAISMPRIAMVRIQELARLFCFCELVAKRWSRPVTPTSREARDLFPLAQTIFGDQCTLVQVTQNLLERFADSSAIAENSAMPPLANAGESKCLSPARSLLRWSSVVLKIETVPGAKCASVRLIGRFARARSGVNSPNRDERTQCCAGDERSDPGELGNLEVVRFLSTRHPASLLLSLQT
jgi:hypothetical protein